jgi:hypothetical protein
LVNNAYASDKIKINKQQQLSFSKLFGTYKINLGDKQIPIFFSGMLGGQRALDKGSSERLQWHIQRAREES